MIVSNLIKASMRKIGVIASGETPTDAEMQDSLAALQSMLRSWSAAKINVFASVKESFNLASATSYYTWGSGGTITTARPNQLLGAFIRDSSGVDHPVDIIDENKYRRISSKATSSRPYAVFFHPLYPLAALYFYPTPASVEACHIDSLKAFTETSSFDSLTATLAMPPYYEEPLIYNLALRMAPEFGKTFPVEDSSVAISSYNKLVNLNAANQVETVNVVIPAGFFGSGYDINSDTYR
jgi:hypothetical protein